MPASHPEPLLQILHYSDIHLAVQGSMYKRWQASGMPPAFRQGLAGARRALLHEFIHLIQDLTSGDKDWENRPIWLVDTGDGTTFGESAALQEWDEWTRKFEQASPGAQLLRVYGNHDAWPQGHPLRAVHAPWKMDTQRDLLRSQHFPQTWPTPPLQIPIPNTSCQIELCLANTVDHRLWPNVFALGVAARDRYWTHLPQIPSATPANDLADRARQERLRGASRSTDCGHALPRSRRRNLGKSFAAKSLEESQTVCQRTSPASHCPTLGNTSLACRSYSRSLPQAWRSASYSCCSMPYPSYPRPMSDRHWLTLSGSIAAPGIAGGSQPARKDAA